MLPNYVMNITLIVETYPDIATVTTRPTLPFSKNITISGSLKHDILGAFRGFASLNPHQSFALDLLVGSHGPQTPSWFAVAAPLSSCFRRPCYGKTNKFHLYLQSDLASSKHQ